jgi:predicted RNA-binding Zn-ribbon protein involved in translation (DUF1610 family)
MLSTDENPRRSGEEELRMKNAKDCLEFVTVGDEYFFDFTCPDCGKVTRLDPDDYTEHGVFTCECGLNLRLENHIKSDLAKMENELLKSLQDGFKSAGFTVKL